MNVLKEWIGRYKRRRIAWFQKRIQGQNLRLVLCFLSERRRGCIAS